MKKNNTWYSIGNPEITYIFIHGLMSDSEKCWTNDNGTFWPDLIKAKPEFGNGSIFLSGYHTDINSGIYDIRQCAMEALQFLKLKRADGLRPIDSQNLVFICHSLGGIICRHILEFEQNIFRQKKIGLILLASPSEGSDYAEAITRISKILGHKVAIELKKTSSKLKDIDDRFRDLINKRELEIIGIEACEQRGPKIFKYLPIRLKRIVDENSASRYFGGTRVLPNTDHMSISKPSDSDHCTHQFLLAFIQEKFQEGFSKKLTEIESNEISLAENVLFDSFNENHKAVYSVRDIDSQIEESLRHRSLWIYGPSGSGKTTAARHAVIQIQGSKNKVEVPLSYLNIDNLKPEELYREIVESVDPKIDNATPKLRSTVQAILSISGSPTIPIIFDEVGISNENNQDYSKLIETMGQILNEVKAKSQTQRNFVVCSINEPHFEIATEKFREYFEKIEIKKWSSTEQRNLIDLILRKLQLEIPNQQNKEQIIEAADGSPRFIKTLFRNIQKDKLTAIDAPNIEKYIETTFDQLKGIT